MFVDFSMSNWTKLIGITIMLIYAFILLFVEYVLIPYFQDISVKEGFKRGFKGIIIGILIIMLTSTGIQYINQYGGVDVTNANNDYNPEIEYLIIASSETEIDVETLEHYNESELYILLIGIYAYQGYIFYDPYYTSYFQNFSWYKPRIEASAFTLDMFTETQRGTISNIWVVNEKYGFGLNEKKP